MAYTARDLQPMHLASLENTQTVWLYLNTAGDSEATIKGASYFSDAYDRKMQAGDVVLCFNLSGAANSAAFLQVNATAPTKAAKGATVAATVVIT